MLGKLLAPLTTASSVGVGIRYGTTIVTTILAILGVFGLLSNEQVEALVKLVPDLLGAVAALVALLIPVYAVLTKARSDKADGVAKAVDADVPPATPVVIQTPAGQPDIVVDRDGRKVSG